MGDAARREYISPWRLEEAQDRLASASSDDAGVRWRSTQNVASRWQKHEIVREFEVENVYSNDVAPTWLGWACASDKESRAARSVQLDEGGQVSSLHKSEAQVTPDCRSPGLTDILHATHTAMKPRTRPQSATASRHPIARDSDFAAAVADSTSRTRPQSAKLPRPPSASRRSTAEQSEVTSALIPPEMKNSRWTEMLSRSPSFQQSNLIKLEQETYNLLQSVFKRERVRAASSQGRPQPSGAKQAKAKKTTNAKHERAASTLLTPTQASTAKRKAKRGAASEIPRGSGLQMARNKHREAARDMVSDADPCHGTLLDHQSQSGGDPRHPRARNSQSGVLNQLNDNKFFLEHTPRAAALNTSKRNSRRTRKTKIGDKAPEVEDDEATARRERVFQEMGWNQPAAKPVTVCAQRVHKCDPSPQFVAQSPRVLEDPTRQPDADTTAQVPSLARSTTQTRESERWTKSARSSVSTITSAGRAAPLDMEEHATSVEPRPESRIEMAPEARCDHQDPDAVDLEPQCSEDLALVHSVDSAIDTGNECNQMDQQLAPDHLSFLGEKDQATVQNDSDSAAVNGTDLEIAIDLLLYTSSAKQVGDTERPAGDGAAATMSERSTRDLPPLGTFGEQTCVLIEPSHFTPPFTEDIETSGSDWCEGQAVSTSGCDNQLSNQADRLQCEVDAQYCELLMPELVEKVNKVDRLDLEPICSVEDQERPRRGSGDADLEVEADICTLEAATASVAVDEVPGHIASGEHDLTPVCTGEAATNFVQQDNSSTVLASPRIILLMDGDEEGDAASPPVCLTAENELHGDQDTQDVVGSDGANTSNVYEVETTATFLQSTGGSSSGDSNEDLESTAQCDDLQAGEVGSTDPATDGCGLVHDDAESIPMSRYDATNDQTQALTSGGADDSVPRDTADMTSAPAERSTVECLYQEDVDDSGADIEASDQDKHAHDVEAVYAGSPIALAGSAATTGTPENATRRDHSGDDTRDRCTDGSGEAYTDSSIAHENEPSRSAHIELTGEVTTVERTTSSEDPPTPSTATRWSCDPSVEEADEGVRGLDDPMPVGSSYASDDDALQSEGLTALEVNTVSIKNCSNEPPEQLAVEEQLPPSIQTAEISSNTLEVTLVDERHDPGSSDTDAATTNGNLIHVTATDSSARSTTISVLQQNTVEPPLLSPATVDTKDAASASERNERKHCEDLRNTPPASSQESEASSNAVKKIQRQYRHSVQRQILVGELRFMLSQHHRQIRKKTRPASKERVGGLVARRSSTSNLVVDDAVPTHSTPTSPIADPAAPRDEPVPEVAAERTESEDTRNQGAEPIEPLGLSEGGCFGTEDRQLENKADPAPAMTLLEAVPIEHASILRSCPLMTESELNVAAAVTSLEYERNSPVCKRSPSDCERRSDAGIDAELRLEPVPAEENTGTLEVPHDQPSPLDSTRVTVRATSASEPSNNNDADLDKPATEAASPTMVDEGDSRANEYGEAAEDLVETGVEWESLGALAWQHQRPAIEEEAVGSVELATSVVFDDTVEPAIDFVTATGFSCSQEPSDAILRARAASVALAALAFDADEVEVDESALLFFPSQTEDPNVFASAPDDRVLAESTGCWERYVDAATSKSYYFNPSTQVSQWTAPEDGSQILNRAVAEVSADSAWRQASGITTSASDIIHQQQQQNQSVLLESFGGWDQYLVPDTGAAFYYHEGRGEYASNDVSDIEPPLEFSEAKAAFLHQQQSDAAVCTGVEYVADVGDDSSEQWRLRRRSSTNTERRGEWQAFTDAASQQTFYYNARTGASTWGPPAEFLSASGGSQFGDVQWSEYIDDISGAAYYVNATTGETSWEKPRERSAAETQAQTAECGTEDDDEYVIRIDEHALEQQLA